MIISTVLDLPKIEPDDWGKFFHLWNNHKQVLNKIRKTHNRAGAHIGLDVYCDSSFTPTYTAPMIDLKTQYPSLYEQIMMLPVPIYCARFIQSFDDFPPHMDSKWSNWAIRNWFYCEDTEPQWYYTPKTDLEQKKWLTLPKESNWWAYLDGQVNHATVFKPQLPKILIQYFVHPLHSKRFVESQMGKFPEFAISF